MKISSSIIVGVFILGIHLISGETVLVKKVSSPSTTLHLLSIYQQGSTVYATSHLEEIEGGIWPLSFEIKSDKLEMDYPSIALHQVEVFSISEENGWKTLYTQGEKQADYDYSMGTGWVDSLSIGTVNIKSYPWIFSEKFGWLFCVEAGIMSRNIGSAYPVLAFWFWSPESGEWFLRRNTH
jgi:hypothetical protein